MRIPSGKTDQYIYFVATLGGTRVTGLSSFTVYRSRNGAASAIFTTPTVGEVDATNLPGVYKLLMDEDTTIASTSDSEEMVVHITATGMDPVSRVVELYRRVVTSGNTLDVNAGGGAEVGTFQAGAITAAAFAANAIDAAALAADAGTEIGTAVWASTTRLLTAGTNIALAKGTGVTGFNDLDAAGVRGAVGMAAANMDTQLGLLATAANLATVAGYVDTEVAAIKAKTDNLPSDPADASDIATSFSTVNSTLAAIAGYIDTEVAAIKAKTDNLPSDPADQSLIIAATDAIMTAVGDVPTNAELATALAGADDAVLAALSALGLTDTAAEVTDIWRIHGLDSSNPMTVTPTSRVAGTVVQAISGDGETTSTVTRA